MPRGRTCVVDCDSNGHTILPMATNDADRPNEPAPGAPKPEIDRTAIRHHFEIQYIFPNGGRKLVSIDEPRKEHPLALTCPRDGDEILVLTKQHTLERGCAVQQRFVLKACGLIVLGGHYINTPPPDASGNGSLDVHVHG